MNTNPNNQSVPQKIDTIASQLDAIMKLLEEGQPIKESPKKLTLKKAIEFMASEGCNLTESSMYKLTSTKGIPFKRFGRKLLFDRDELREWCKDKTSASNLENQVTINLAHKANKK
jgi:excisionase family DNA binding protein